MRHKSKEVALLAISLLMLAGCNEKISAELQSGSTVTPPTVDPTTFTFKVTETSNVNLGYSLHKTGQGNGLKSCEVNKDTYPFKNDDYIGNQPEFDITCYMEAEELAIYASGMKFKVEASPNACEYVSYSPYSYFHLMPGDSTAKFKVVTCETGVTSLDTPGFAAVYGAGNTPAGCDQYVDQSLDESGSVIVPTASKRPITLSEDGAEEELCRYNYSIKTSSNPNCDIGEITIEEVNLSLVSGVVTPSAPATRKIQCGGEVKNCIKGPIRLESKLDNYTSGSIITEMVDSVAYSKEYVYPGLINAIPQPTMNIGYTNFRRYLASTEINFWNQALSVFFPGAFLTNSVIDYNFEPMVMDAYSSNIKLDGSDLIDPATVVTTASLEVGYATKPLAAEPYIGFVDGSDPDPSKHYYYQVNPFYTFECLDNAYETAARIRIVVRDWDRVFDKAASYMEYISDYDYGMSARMDRQYYPGVDPSDFNNRKDWDDSYKLTRRTGAFDPSLTWWLPRNEVFKRDPTRDSLKSWNFPGSL